MTASATGGVSYSPRMGTAGRGYGAHSRFTDLLPFCSFALLWGTFGTLYKVCRELYSLIITSECRMLDLWVKSMEPDAP